MQTATLFVLDPAAGDANSDAARSIAARVNSTSQSHRVEVVDVTAAAALREPLPTTLHGVPTVVLPDNTTVTGAAAMQSLSGWCVETVESASQVRRPPRGAATESRAIVEEK